MLWNMLLGIVFVVALAGVLLGITSRKRVILWISVPGALLAAGGMVAVWLLL